MATFAAGNDITDFFFAIRAGFHGLYAALLLAPPGFCGPFGDAGALGRREALSAGLTPLAGTELAKGHGSRVLFACGLGHDAMR